MGRRKSDHIRPCFIKFLGDGYTEKYELDLCGKISSKSVKYGTKKKNNAFIFNLETTPDYIEVLSLISGFEQKYIMELSSY